VVAVFVLSKKSKFLTFIPHKKLLDMEIWTSSCFIGILILSRKCINPLAARNNTLTGRDRHRHDLGVVAIDGIWIGEWIYCPLVCTTQNYTDH
jgi:hypothetical protein